MLRYARHHGLAQSSSFTLEDLLRHTKLDFIDNADAIDCTDLQSIPPFYKEHYVLSRDTLSWLQAVILSPKSSPSLKVRKRIRSNLEEPLEHRRWSHVVDYKVPRTFSDLLSDWHQEDVYEDMLQYDELCRLISIEGRKTTVESLACEHVEVESFLKCKVSRDSRTTSNQASQVPPTIDLYIDLPLLPILRKCTELHLVPEMDAQDCAVDLIPDLFKEEERNFTQEKISLTTEYLDEIRSHASAANALVTTTKRQSFEIDMPLTPRPFDSSKPTIQLDVEASLQLDQDVLDLSPDIPKSQNLLRHALDLHSHGGQFQTFLNENLVQHDPTLYLPEPAVGSIVDDSERIERQALYDHKSFLARDHGGCSAEFAMNCIAIDDLDERMIWDPFGRVLQPVNLLETLSNAEIIEDYITVPAGIQIHATTANLSGTRSRNSLASPMSSIICPMNQKKVDMSFPDHVTIDRDCGTESETNTRPLSSPENMLPGNLDMLSSECGAHPVMYDTGKSLASCPPQVNIQRQSTAADSNVRADSSWPDGSPSTSTTWTSLTPVDITFDSLVTNQARGTTKGPTLSAELEPSAFACDERCGRSSTSKLSVPETLAIEYQSPTARHEEVVSSRKRLFSQIHAGSAQVATPRFSISANVARYMRLQGRQASESRCLDRLEVSSGPQKLEEPRQLISPRLVPESPGEQWWVISTSFLGQQAMSRPLRKNFQNVTMIERELPAMSEPDLILSPSTSLTIMRKEYVMGCSAEAVSPAQQRIDALSRKFSTLIVLVKCTGLTEPESVELACFQGWAARFKNLNLKVLTSEEELVAYLLYIVRISTTQPESLQCEETWTEQFLRQCPYLNAMSAQMVARRTTLHDFLRISHVGKLEILHHVGIDDERSQLAARFFGGNWHHPESVVDEPDNFDYVEDGAL